MTSYSLDFPHAHLNEKPQAGFRQTAQDFEVEEELGFQLSGNGEHLWLKIEKTGLNTIDVARLIAEKTATRMQDIGYAGLKDKLAVTRQWFSVKSSVELSDTDFGQPAIKILERQRNTRKLRRGSHRGNAFRITLRDISVDSAWIVSVCSTLAAQGVPNYFGPQRFGHGGNNIARAEALFNGKLAKLPRFQRGIILSAARSFLFNQVLAARVSDGSWNQCMPGELMALAGSSSVFKAEEGGQAIPGRLAAMDIHPTGPLWGKGELASAGQVKSLEQGIIEKYEVLSRGLADAGLKQERRALRLVPQNLSIKTAGDKELMVEFSLPTGAFATSVLREMVSAPGL